MKIDLTNEMIEGEPGPNLYFMGSMSDFDLLVGWIEKLASKTKIEILLNDAFEGLETITPGLKIILKSSKRGCVLSKMEKLTVTMDLKPIYWEKVLNQVTAISKKQGLAYIEFDNLDLREDCNVMMSSEW